MNVLNKDEFTHKGPLMKKKLKDSVFIYPTDTIYGIGCDATNSVQVERIRQIKERYDMPFSVIAPSIQWIEDNCVITAKAKEWFRKLPGPYTLIMKLKNKDAVVEGVLLGLDSIGVRMPDNWFTKFVSDMKVPVVTTSANKSGDDFMTGIDNLNKEIKLEVDYVIEDGELNGKPSTLVFLNKDEVELKER